MTYSTDPLVRSISGRLALDFLNTANWSAKDEIVQDKIETLSDLDVWMNALGLPQATHPSSVEDVHALRSKLRSIFLIQIQTEDIGTKHYPHTLETRGLSLSGTLHRQPILDLITVSALSLLIDMREIQRVKRCPGIDCGWLFIDETKNARRKWCVMELCGNRAKASRNYARRTQS